MMRFARREFGFWIVGDELHPNDELNFLNPKSKI